MNPRPLHMRLVSQPPPSTDDRGAPEGHRPAQELDALYRSYSPYVAGIAARILGRDHEVDDLVQDAFINALRGLSALREPLAIKGWLAKITVRLATRRLRARRLRRALYLDRDVLDYEPICAGGATQEERALVARVYRELDKMSASDRVAWVLRYVEGEPLHRIPELCACSLSTAQRRLARAQAALQVALEVESDKEHGHG